jgi:anti-sigma-K factor RskA
MNERQPPDHDMLDEVAVYALGVLPAAEAQRVREHMASCALCREEYDRLISVASVVGLSAETSGDARECPSTLLKPRIMQKIRSQAVRPAAPIAPVKPAGISRSQAWPAYFVAAACFAIAIVSSVWNIALTGQLKSAQQELARSTQRSTALAQSLADERATLSDMVNAGAKRYVVGQSEVVTRGSRVYIAMHDLPELPRGRVYQAWTLPKGGKNMVPSVTFVPDSRGVAVVTLSPDARATAIVAVSVEPEGGSKQPTTKPILVVPLS